RSFVPEWNRHPAYRLKRIVLGWCAPVAILILGWLFVRQAAPGTPSAPDSAAATAAVHADSLQNQVAEAREQGDVSPSNRSSQDVHPPVAAPQRASKPRLLLALLTPVKLFTGVLACGLICFLVIWMDRRFLPAVLQPPLAITTMNVLAGIVFFA